MPADSPTFGPYLVLERLSAGGSCTVYRAVRRDVAGERSYALKRRPGSRADRPARPFVPPLSHVNLAEPVEHGAIAGETYLAVEWVDGPSLEQLVAEGGPLSAAAGARLVAEAARGIDWLHQRQVGGIRLVHGRLAPRKVLVGRRGDVKVAGVEHAIAGWASGDASDTQDDGFRAPEALAGEPLDGRTDVWSLGALLVYALTGTPPGMDTAASWRSGVPEDLRPMLERALSISRGERYSTAGALRQALQTWLAAYEPAFDRGALAAMVLERGARSPAVDEASCDPRDALEEGDERPPGRLTRMTNGHAAIRNGRNGSAPSVSHGAGGTAHESFGVTSTFPTAAEPPFGRPPGAASAAPATIVPSSSAAAGTPVDRFRRAHGPVPAVAIGIAGVALALALGIAALPSSAPSTQHAARAARDGDPPKALGGLPEGAPQGATVPILKAVAAALCTSPPGGPPVFPSELQDRLRRAGTHEAARGIAARLFAGGTLSASEEAALEAELASGTRGLAPLAVLAQPRDVQRRVRLLREQTSLRRWRSDPGPYPELCERREAAQSLVRLAPGSPLAQPYATWLAALPVGTTIEDITMRLRVLRAWRRTDGLVVELRLENFGPAPIRPRLDQVRLVVEDDAKLAPAAIHGDSPIAPGARSEVALRFDAPTANPAIGGLLELAGGRTLAFDIDARDPPARRHRR